MDLFAAILGVSFSFGMILKETKWDFSFWGKKKRKSSFIDFITAQTRPQGLKFLAPVNNPSSGYDQITSLVAESVADKAPIPGDLILEILRNLPVKSLARFKAVCKAWKLLIDSDYFVHEHMHRPNPECGGYAVRFAAGDDRFPLQVRNIVGACNGVLCLSVYVSDYNRYLILFNPATTKFSFVPNVPRSWDFAAFCYISETRKYQIVLFTYVTGTHVDITTVTLGKITSFRDAKRVSKPGKITDHLHSVCGSTIYWLGLDDGREFVMCYDVVERRFSEMNMPPYKFSLVRMPKSIKEFKDTVIMFVSPTETFFDMWMLVDDVSNGKSWIKYQRVGPFECACPVEVCWDNRWILCMRTPSVQRDKYVRQNLFYYDLETDQVVDYHDFQPAINPPVLMFANYVESLVSISSLVPYVDTDFR